ncbi:hypothetical protein [Flammeovirga sp. SJP92]|uniref:hypothetical protein n=1 Tax=Flammeovirga sp. SJP92 TaxID=1775430 RepID=UPI0007873B3B|nr:hypothetical protein [Flammeovirga sp. SJP92]KXX72464.1 hypothetical protein AVL50_02355 [Flammeovirga sp. SJP92]
MFDYQEREKNEDKTQSSFFQMAKFWDIPTPTIDPKNPEPVKVYIRSKTVQNNDKADTTIYIALSKGYFENNSIERPCHIIFDWRDSFIEHELKLPNSIIEILQQKLKINFSGVKYIQNESSKVTSPTLRALFSEEDNQKIDEETKSSESFSSLSQKTPLSKIQGHNGHYPIHDREDGIQLSELLQYYGLSQKYEAQFNQNYVYFQAQKPKNIDYENIAKAFYQEVNPEYGYFKTLLKSAFNYFDFRKGPIDRFVQTLKDQRDLTKAAYTDLYHFFIGPDDDVIFDELVKIHNHPPSIRKLEETFTALYPGEKDLRSFLIEAMPEHRKICLQYIPNTRDTALDLPYETIGTNIMKYHTRYFNEKKNITQYNTRVNNRNRQINRRLRKNIQSGIQKELEKLQLNAKSVEQLNMTEALGGKALHEILMEIGIHEELSYLLPKSNLINWVDTSYVEDVYYNMEEMLERNDEHPDYAKMSTPFSEGVLIRYNDTGAYGYIVKQNDNFSGIETRFRISKEELSDTNWWDGFDEQGRYIIGTDPHWLMEGDLLELPEGFQPLNNETFYIYDRFTKEGIKAVKNQGQYKKIPIRSSSFLELKDKLAEKINSIDDNTKTFGAQFEISLDINAQVSALFYIGVKFGGGVNMASGDARNFTVNSQCFLNLSAGFGKKNVANAGLEAGGKRSLNPTHFNSLNGSYNSYKHFEAFFSRSLYLFMKDNGMHHELVKHGIDDGYWQSELDNDGDVWKELNKGYTRKVRTSTHVQAEAGIDSVFSLNMGREWSSSQSLRVDGIKNMDDLNKSDDVYYQRALKDDHSYTNYANLEIGDGTKLSISMSEYDFDINKDNLGKYLNISITIPGRDIWKGIKGSIDLKNHPITQGIKRNRELNKGIASFDEVIHQNQGKIDDLMHQRGMRPERRGIQRENIELTRDQNKLKKERDLLRRDMVNKIKGNATKLKEELKAQPALKKKFDKSLTGKIDEYTRFEWNFIDINNEYHKQYFRITEGGKIQVKAGVDTGIVSTEAEFNGSVEFQIYESLGDNTISYVSTVYNGIHREAINRLNDEEKDQLKIFIDQAVTTVKDQGPYSLFFFLKEDSIYLLEDYVKDLENSYHENQKPLQLPPLDGLHKGYLLRQRNQYSKIMASFRNDLSNQNGTNSVFSISSFSEQQKVFLNNIAQQLFDELPALKHQPPILTTSQLFKSFNSTDPEFVKLKEKLLGEGIGHGQWEKFKKTRGMSGSPKEIKSLATSFALDVKTSVYDYVKTIDDPKDASWSRCKLKELTSEQAYYYLGDIKDIVRYIKEKNRSRMTNRGNKADHNGLKVGDIKASNLMKKILKNDNEEEQDFSVEFENEILYPLLLENIIYGKQIY